MSIVYTEHHQVEIIYTLSGRVPEGASVDGVVVVKAGGMAYSYFA